MTMEKNCPLMTAAQARMLSALQLAFMGDTICDLLTRSRLMQTDSRVQLMHSKAAGIVNARAQARQLAKIMPLLEEEELQLVKRARNAHPGHTVPRGASREEYMLATAYEALLGYLYLTGNMNRAAFLYDCANKETEA